MEPGPMEPGPMELEQLQRRRAVPTRRRRAAPPCCRSSAPRAKGGGAPTTGSGCGCGLPHVGQRVDREFACGRSIGKPALRCLPADATLRIEDAKLQAAIRFVGIYSPVSTTTLTKKKKKKSKLRGGLRDKNNSVHLPVHLSTLTCLAGQGRRAVQKPPGAAGQYSGHKEPSK